MGNALMVVLKIVLGIFTILFVAGVIQALKDSNKKKSVHH